MITIDMKKARDITRDMIRTERISAFERLDIAYMRASEAEDKASMSEIVKIKQVLRDLPASPSIELANTPEELEHIARNSVESSLKTKELEDG